MHLSENEVSINEPHEYAWFSTKNFYHRFEIDDLPPNIRVKRLMEEVGELIQASALYDAHQASRMEMLQEAADVIITTYGILQAHGVIFDEFENVLYNKSLKNDQKTPSTHHLVGDKVIKK